MMSTQFISGAMLLSKLFFKEVRAMDLFKGLFDLDDDGKFDSGESAFEFGAVEELLEEDDDEFGDEFDDEDDGDSEDENDEAYEDDDDLYEDDDL
jgi:hypothetical protein